MRERTGIRKLLYFCLLLALVLIMIFSGLRILESTILSDSLSSGEAGPSKTITRNGIDYFPRQDITVMMVLGIDQNGPVKASGSYNNQGAADMVALLVMDETNETVQILMLNRDTMLDMPVLGLGGKQAGSLYGQLALSHTYGTGLEDSCENTRKTVSDLLYGLRIDYYFAMNMDAIGVLNDAVGGVTVTVTEDFSQVAPEIVKGEMTLRGQQAMQYVRTRRDLGDQLNVSRMERQRDYMEGFMEAFRGKLENSDSFALTVYEEVSDYVVTDISVNAFSGMLQRYSDYTLTGVVTPEGENVRGEEYYEFHLDAEALDELILQLFYVPKK